MVALSAPKVLRLPNRAVQVGWTVGRNALQMIIVALGATFLIFALLRTIPGDPAQILAGPGGSVTPAQIAKTRLELGLDKPLVTQYWDWISSAAQGNFGHSLVLNDTVAQLLSSRLLVTLQLATYSLFFALALSIPLSVLAARWQGNGADSLVRVVSATGVAIPSFWLALLLIIAFQGVLPTFGYAPFGDGIVPHLQHMVLPSMALGAGLTTLLFETNRASLVATLSSDYVRTARSFGLSERKIYNRYALRNALLPTITVAGLEIGSLMAGALLVENAFAIPGMGRLLVQGVLSRDYPVVQGCILVLVTIVVALNLTMDVVYAVVDPRVRRGRG